MLTTVGTVLAVLAATPTLAHAGTTPSAHHPAAASATAGAAGASAAAKPRTVTLITGDRVTVTALADGKSAATVVRPKNLTGGVQTQTVGKDLYVYPTEALPYVAAGVLDQRLFDVTGLIADGYDDAGSTSLPLIVQYGAPGAAAKAAPALPGLTVRGTLPSIGGAAESAALAQTSRLWQQLAPTAALTRAKALSAKVAPLSPQARQQAVAANPVFGSGISRIWLDGKVKATLADSTAQIGAPDAWNAGVDGKGVDVAILDTGVDAGHPDFAGQIAASQSFVPGEDTTDRVGHGTHTASTIAGTGAASDGKEKGVAPGAKLLVGKVLDDTGYGDESWVIAGMQWAAQTEHARVISMSLGSADPSDGTDPLSQAVNDLSAATGSLFVIAAGNSDAAGIGAPGAATSALTVGAVDSSDALAYFSSWGPRLTDGGLKPEITAPGVDILAARSQYTDGSGPYVTMSGTSMATPHVAGAAALLAEQHPDWTGQQLKDALVSTSRLTPGIALTQGGAGRVDAKAAVLGGIDASATAWSGYYPWPNAGAKPTAQPVSYTNTGDSAVTLDLAVKAADADGSAAPAGIFTLSAPTVTVPAHGTASVTVTGDPAAAGPGVTDGQLEATDSTGAVLAHTLVGIDREDERYNLTVKATDRTSAPLSGVAVVYRTGDEYPTQIEIPASGSLSLRLPKGEYSVLMYADLPGAAGPDDLGLGVLSVPQLQLDRNREADLDARKAHLVSSVVPQPAENQLTRVEWNRVAGGSAFNENFLLPPAYTSVWAQSTAKVTSGSFQFDTRWRKAAPLLTVTAAQARFPSESFPDLLVQPGSTMLPAGRTQLGVVYAGLGTTADYAGLNAKGKAVVVSYDRQADPTTQFGVDSAQAAAAAKAGAKLLLVVNDNVGRLNDWYGSADFSANSPIEVASLQPGEGASLISATTRPGLKLTVGSTPSSPYVYDLVERHDGAVPAGDLTYRPKQSDLARVDSRFGGPTTATGDEGRYDMQDFDQYGVGFQTLQALGTTRTDWVTPGNGTFSWYDEADNAAVQERSLITPAVKGARTGSDWFLAAFRPRLNESQGLPDRQDDFMSLNVPGWGDSGTGHDGFDQNLWGEGDQLHETVTLYQGSKNLGSTLYQQLNVDLPSGDPLPYRLVAATSQSGVLPNSPASRTEWGFTSGTSTVLLPLIQLDYGLPTDLNGDVPRSTTLTLAASQLAGVTGGGTINGATLQVSYNDGSDWVATTLKKQADGSWTTALKAPRSAAFLSLRATAKDSAGNTVSQTVLRAYGLR
ncbi:S8 family serine peptidase [Streptacidiphilus sp. PAMC 29251]